MKINLRNFFSFNDATRRKEHNNNNTTTEWNEGRIKTAEAGFLNPIKQITDGVRNGVIDTLKGIYNFGARTIKLGSTAILGAIALPINLLKWGWDNSVQLAGSAAVIAATRGGEALTWPSRVAQSTHNKVIKTFPQLESKKPNN